MKKAQIFLISVSLISQALFAQAASEQQPLGPIATACKAEIEKLCADKKHVYGEVRQCLESKKAELSEACAKNLELTGPRRGMGRGKK